MIAAEQYDKMRQMLVCVITLGWALLDDVASLWLLRGLCNCQRCSEFHLHRSLTEAEFVTSAR